MPPSEPLKKGLTERHMVQASLVFISWSLFGRSAQVPTITILLKIITRTKVLFSDYLDITVTAFGGFSN